MITKKLKASLFALLVMAVAVPAASVGFANEVYSAKQVDIALKELQPFVELDDSKIGTLDAKAAKENGVSDESVQIASEFLKAQNNMIQRIHDNPNQRMYLAEEDYAKFSDYSRSIEEGKQRGENPAKVLGIQLAYAEDVCGGSGENPHPQPDTTFSGPWSTESAAINALPGGYYLVPYYASYNYGADYHDPRTLYNCTTDSFRYQSIIFEDDGDWYHSEHHSPGEPNPEVLAYTWPVWWWGGYVADWHLS